MVEDVTGVDRFVRFDTGIEELDTGVDEFDAGVDDGGGVFRPGDAGAPALPGGWAEGALGMTDDQWMRPDATCASSTIASYFDTFMYTNGPASDTVDIVVQFDDYDGYLHAFRGSFLPSSPTTNCAAGDDDDVSTRVSRIANFALAPSETITVVISSYGSLATGAWSLAIVPSP